MLSGHAKQVRTMCLRASDTNRLEKNDQEGWLCTWSQAGVFWVRGGEENAE